LHSPFPQKYATHGSGLLFFQSPHIAAEEKGGLLCYVEKKATVTQPTEELLLGANLLNLNFMKTFHVEHSACQNTYTAWAQLLPGSSYKTRRPSKQLRSVNCFWQLGQPNIYQIWRRALSGNNKEVLLHRERVYLKRSINSR